METTKCELIEYRGKHYLIFTEKKELKTGDKVLTPFFIPLQTITGRAGGWDLDGFYCVSNSGARLWGNALTVVAATEKEISSDDLIRLKEETFCYVLTENGKPYFLEGKIVIKF